MPAGTILGRQVFYHSIKLEEGNKITAWSPAPSDDVKGSQIISSINISPEEIKINSNKIELTANDILNLLAGNTINIESKNIKISSTNFNVNENGDIIANSATLNNATFNNGKIHLTGNGNFFVGEKNSEQVNIDAGEIAVYKSAMESTSISGTLILIASLLQSTSIQASGIETPVLTQTSLESKKKNFEKFNNALDILKQIEIYKYNLKSEEDIDKKHIGFVIGDNYKYSKEVTNKDNTGVDDYSFISLCCRAIQEQQSIIEEQNKTIDKQNKTIEDILSRVEKLEQKAGEA